MAEDGSTPPPARESHGSATTHSLLEDALNGLESCPTAELLEISESSDYEDVPNVLTDALAPSLLGSPPATPQRSQNHAPTTQFPQSPVAPHADREVLPPFKRAQVWDKLAFVLGSTCLWVCAFWLGHRPQSFWKLYSVLGVVLVSARYAIYRSKKWHYYLLDLCYACNALLMVHLWVAPGNQLLARTTFAFNTGPLTASIMAFRNSLVYHDMDKVTSLYLHLVPACVSWAQRWYPDTTRFTTTRNSSPAGVSDLILAPLLFYVIWAASYSYVVFVLAAERIRRKGYVTLFTYVTTRKSGVYAEIASRVPPAAQPLVYLVLHMLFCACGLLLAYAAWHSFLWHNTLLITAATLAISNGATYYFDIFAKRHRADSSPLMANGKNKPE